MAKKKKRDIGHEETEKVLKDLEKRIAKEYAQAEEELTVKFEKYIINTGDFSGARWKEMRDTIAQDLSNTDQIARSIAYDYMPEVYAINHNYGTYQVERESRIKTSYTMYDKHTAQRLFNDNNTFYHGPGQRISEKIKMGKTVAWNKRQVQSALTQYVLQGESVQALAKRLRNTVGDSIDQSDLKGIANLTAKQIAKVLERKNKNAAIRNARTMATGVQNAGRIDAYKRAESMGIEMEKEWLAVMDGRTRHEHRILDGQHVPVDKDFEVEGYKIKYPGDPSADACMIYNCRCTLVPRLAIEEGKSNKNKMHNGNPALGNMSYDEWKKGQKVPKTSIGTIVNNATTSSEPSYTERLTLDKQRALFRAGIQNADNEDLKRLLTEADERVIYQKSDNGYAYILTFDDGRKSIIKLEPVNTAGDVAHEVFHDIDNFYGITKNGALTTSLVKDYNKLSKIDIIDYLHKNYEDAFEYGDVLKPEYAGISDIIHGCSGGNIDLGYGHYEDQNGVPYWKNNKVEIEAFAELGKIYYENNDEVIEMLEALFPNIAKEFLTILRRV